MHCLLLDSDKIQGKYPCVGGNISPYEAGIPLFECSDAIIEEVYYYRWYVYCKHIRKTPEGHVVTEFYPDVPWASKYNAISCPLGHQLYEGRWLHNTQYLEDYIRFWFEDADADLRSYSSWVTDAILQVCALQGDFSLAASLYDKLKENYAAWEKTNLRKSGLFYQIDDRDGMEYSAGGSGFRPTINSYMYADAVALSKLAKRLGKAKEEEIYYNKAQDIKEKINKYLWNAQDSFFETLRECVPYEPVGVREQVGFVPWYFNVPDADKCDAWKFLTDEKHFAAPYGPTTAERCCPDFMKQFDHECLWNGPSWPYATSQTLTALANLLCNYTQSIMGKSDFYRLLHTYANSQYDTLPNGSRVAYIDENLDPFTGEWIARRILRTMDNPPGGMERGADYNHSTYCDLVLSGLVGVRVRDDDVLHIEPLFAEGDLRYLCADGILYRGHKLCIIWDADGLRYGRGKGFRIYCDDKNIYATDHLCKFEMGLEELK